MPINKYPNLPKEEIEEKSDNFEIKTFRLNTITEIQRELEKDLTNYNRTKRRYSSIFNTATYLNTGFGSLSALTAGSSVGLLATGVGVPVALPLGCISLTLALFSMTTSAFNKKIKVKLQKHTAMVQLIMAKLSSFRLIISKALQDSQITDEEFSRLQADYNDYKMQKFELQKKSRMNFTQPQDIEAIKKECEKKINDTLKSVLGK